MAARETPATLILVVAVHKSGTHLVKRLTTELGYAAVEPDRDLLDAAEREPPERFLSRFERPTACFFSGMTVDMMPPPLLRHWRRTGEPPIVFHYRDPRAVLLSQVDYLRRRSHGGAFTPTATHEVYSDILAAQPDDPAALDVAIRSMSDYLRRSFESSLWLRHHPQVCRTHYEELVGPQGGGSEAAQLAAVRRVLLHVGLRDEDPSRVAATLYGRTERTFFRGDAHRWRSTYSPEQLALFERKYWDLLELYGDAGDGGRHGGPPAAQAE